MAQEKSVKPRIVAIWIRPKDDQALTQARAELSITLNPLSLAELMEAAHVACGRSATLRNLFKTRAPQIAESPISAEDCKSSTVRLDNRVCEWIKKECPDFAFTTATNLFIRWIAEDFDQIKNHIYQHMKC